MGWGFDIYHKYAYKLPPRGQIIPVKYCTNISPPPGGGGGATPTHYLCGYVPPNGVVILKLLILNGVSISEAFSRTGYEKLWIKALSSA